MRDWEAAVSRDYGEWLRLTAGTSRIDAMDFQSSDPVFGFSAEKREGIGRTSVLGDRYSKHITIETESTADVYVNGKLVRSERIMPGRYDVTAFPLVPGLNVVEMVITDIYGTKNVLTGSVTHAPRIPDPGEYEYGAAAGAAGTDKDAFLARGYYRRGFTDFFGADFYTEMTKDARMAGSTLLASAVPGFFELGGAFLVSESYSPAEMEYGVVGRYSFSSSAGKWLPSAGLSALFRTEQFTAPGSLIDAYRPYVPPWVFSLTVTQPLPKDSSLLAGARYTVGRDEISNTASIYSYYARRLSRLLTLRAGISFDYNGEENTLRGSISVGSMAKDGKGSYSATYYTDGHEVDLGASRRFSGSYGNGSAGVNITRLDIAEGSAQGISGNANGGNDRMEASASVSVVPDEEGFFNSPQRVSFSTRFGSGIYFADGLAGAGKPSEGSFAVIGKSDTFPEGDLLVNPGEKTREASSGILGNAVLASLPDYHEKIINIDLPDLPMDYSIANSSFIIETGYRSGTAIRIEGGRLFFGSGRLIDSAGNPAGLTVFRITDRNTGSRFTTFTDEGGYFYIYDLYPGNYLIEMPGDEEALAFTVSDTAEVPFDLGEIVTEFFRE